MTDVSGFCKSRAQASQQYQIVPFSRSVHVRFLSKATVVSVQQCDFSSEVNTPFLSVTLLVSLKLVSQKPILEEISSALQSTGNNSQKLIQPFYLFCEIQKSNVLAFIVDCRSAGFSLGLLLANKFKPKCLGLDHCREEHRSSAKWAFAWGAVKAGKLKRHLWMLTSQQTFFSPTVNSTVPLIYSHQTGKSAYS